MANIGAGEFNPAYLIKRENVTVVDSYLKATVPIEEMQELGVIRKFKYRYLTDSEMISQPIAGWLKGKTVMVIYTSEKNITFNEYDKSDFKSADELSINLFCDILSQNNLEVTVRRSKGKDISAACGQLRLNNRE